MQKIIIINGKGGVGKDTLCEFASRHFNIRNVSSITPIKEIAKKCGWNGVKDDKSRKFLSDLKSILISFNDYPTNYLIKEIKSFNDSQDDILFIHIRECSEINKLVEFVNHSLPNIECVTMLIKRAACEQNWGNSSDDEVENYNYDYIYYNDKPLEIAEMDFVNYIKDIFPYIDKENSKDVLEVETPFGTLIAKVAPDSKEYPGISIYLRDKNGLTISLSLLEYNKNDNMLRNIVWDNTNEEPISIVNLNLEDD